MTRDSADVSRAADPANRGLSRGRAERSSSTSLQRTAVNQLPVLFAPRHDRATSLLKTNMVERNPFLRELRPDRPPLPPLRRRDRRLCTALLLAFAADPRFHAPSYNASRQLGRRELRQATSCRQISTEPTVPMSLLDVEISNSANPRYFRGRVNGIHFTPRRFITGLTNVPGTGFEELSRRQPTHYAEAAVSRPHFMKRERSSRPSIFGCATAAGWQC